MRVIADGDLAELLKTGNNRKYRDIARTPRVDERFEKGCRDSLVCIVR